MAKDAWLTWPKQGLLSPFLGLSSLSLAIVSPTVFSFALYSTFYSSWFTLQCSIVTGAPGAVSRGTRRLFSWWFFRHPDCCMFPASFCASCVIFHLLHSVVSGPSLGRKRGLFRAEKLLNNQTSRAMKIETSKELEQALQSLLQLWKFFCCCYCFVVVCLFVF